MQVDLLVQRSSAVPDIYEAQLGQVQHHEPTPLVNCLVQEVTQLKHGNVVNLTANSEYGLEPVEADRNTEVSGGTVAGCHHSHVPGDHLIGELPRWPLDPWSIMDRPIIILGRGVSPRTDARKAH